MLVVVQHPITDVRGLIGSVSHRIGAPRWPRPLRVYPRGSTDDCRTDFIRGIGPVRQRLRGNPSPWLNEDYYVDARGAIVLTGMSFDPKNDTGRVRLHPVFRRFYSDGVVARFEFGFTCRGRGTQGPDLTVVDNITQAALTVSTRLRGADSAKGELLANSGRVMAECLLRGTTRHTVNGFTPPRWWVREGEPAVFVELQRTATTVDPELATRLWHHWPIVSNRRISCWTIRDTPDTNRELLRRLRVQLSHLHAELSALEMVLAFCQNGDLDVDQPAIATFLHTVCGSLLKRERNGVAQSDYLAEVVEAAEGYVSDKVSMLRVLSDRVASKGLARQLRDLAARFETAVLTNPGTVFNFALGDNVNEKNEFKATNIGVAASGRAKVDVDTISQNSGSSSEDLKALVERLVSVVTELRGAVPDEVADQAEDTADGIRNELQKDRPDANRLKRRIASLASLLRGVGAIGGAAVSAVEAIRAALGM